MIINLKQTFTIEQVGKDVHFTSVGGVICVVKTESNEQATEKYKFAIRGTNEGKSYISFDIEKEEEEKVLPLQVRKCPHCGVVMGEDDCLFVEPPNKLRCEACLEFKLRCGACLDL